MTFRFHSFLIRHPPFVSSKIPLKGYEIITDCPQLAGTKSTVMMKALRDPKNSRFQNTDPYSNDIWDKVLIAASVVLGVVALVVAAVSLSL